MNRTLNLLLALACVCSLVPHLPMQASSLIAQAQTDVQPSESAKLTEKEIRTKAEKITVRVFLENVEDYKASGILIDKQERKQDGQPVYLYLVLTNKHVLEGLNKRVKASQRGYRVQTVDGQTPPAFLSPKLEGKGNDLGLLWFSSSTPYETAKLGDSKRLKAEDKVFVSGFPCEDDKLCKEGFTFNSGEAFIELIKSGKYLDAGYQLGFTNETKTGMSGGPVLDQRGLVVGINGRGKNQDLGWRSGDPSVEDINPYAYMDGTEPPPKTKDRFKQLAWAIPIETYRNYKHQNAFNSLQVPKSKELALSNQNFSPSNSPTASPHFGKSEGNKEKLQILTWENSLLILSILGCAGCGATGFLLGKKPGHSQENKNLKTRAIKSVTTHPANPIQRVSDIHHYVAIIINSSNKSVEISIKSSTLVLKKVNKTPCGSYRDRFDHIEFQGRDSKLVVEGDCLKVIPVISKDFKSKCKELEICIINDFPNNADRFIPETNVSYYQLSKQKQEGNVEENWVLYLGENLPINFSPLVVYFIEKRY